MLSQTLSDVKYRDWRKNGGFDNGGIRWYVKQCSWELFQQLALTYRPNESFGRILGPRGLERPPNKGYIRTYVGYILFLDTCKY